MPYNPSQHSAIKIAQKKIHLMHLQEQTGVKFNISLAEQLLSKVDLEMAAIAAEVEPQLPDKTLSASNTKLPPKKQIKLNGEPTSHAFKYFPNLRLSDEHKGWVFDHPELHQVCKIPWNEPLITKAKMTLANQGDIKDWLLSQGWEPTFWNFKKDADGKPERDDKGKLIQTSPKIQEAGTICPNLLDMDGELIRPIVKWLSLRNRRSVIQASDEGKDTGWLNHPRLAVDGRLPASWSSVAKSHRIQHKIVCNVPKADPKVVLGKEMRSLFTCDTGYKNVGYDASGLEARVMAHFCVPMDTQALTRSGWKSYDELVEGEEILAYDPETKTKKWTPLKSKFKFENAEVKSIQVGRSVIRATGNHRWFVEYRNTTTGRYEDKVVTTDGLNTACRIIMNAPMDSSEDVTTRKSNLAPNKYQQDWVRMVLEMSHNERLSWLEGFLVADGYCKVKTEREPNRGETWHWGQNDGNIAEAALLASYLVHSGRVCVSRRVNKFNTMLIATLSKRNFLGMQKGKVANHSVEDVWCPSTEYGSWVMRQGDVITITGNTIKFDKGAFAKLLLEGDIHSYTAKNLFPKQLAKFDIFSPDFDKDNPEFKPWRNKAKGLLYALNVGA